MASVLLRNIPKLRFYPGRSLRFLPRHISCESFRLVNPHSIIPTLSSPTISRYEYSTKSTPEKDQKQENSPVTLQQKLKKAVAQYGSTVIVFHVSISLVSLGVCYLVVSSGLDVGSFLAAIGISGETATKIAKNAGTFGLAYAVHKVFAPVRIMITLTATPFIVRYLRQIGVLKKAVK